CSSQPEQFTLTGIPVQQSDCASWNLSLLKRIKAAQYRNRRNDWQVRLFTLSVCASPYSPPCRTSNARALSPSAGSGRRVDQLRVDGVEPLAPGQLAEVDLLLVELLALRPAAEAAEVVVIDLVEGERARIGVPLLARRFLAQVELGLGIGRDRGKILL